jgi:uncharacterized membrane protein YbaN (DUF454 family)
METVIALWFLGAALVAVGIAGMLLPALPGPPLLFAGFVIAAWAENFEYVGYGTLAVLAWVLHLALWSEFSLVFQAYCSVPSSAQYLASLPSTTTYTLQGEPVSAPPWASCWVQRQRWQLRLPW